jgi:hypothetical protein
LLLPLLLLLLLLQVLVEAPDLMNDVLDGDIMGSFCPTSSV